MKKETGLLGFKCPKRNFEPVEKWYCFTQCQDRCNPLPLLSALMRDRAKVDNVFSVTEILSPAQIGRLRRTTGYFTTPDAAIWATFGEGWHNVMLNQEEALSPEHILEERFTVDITDKIQLTGQFDYYDSGEKILWDFKTTKVYPVKKMMAGEWDNHWREQVNLYRLYGRPEAERMKIKAIVKDWSKWEQYKNGITPTMEFDVPILNEEYLRGMVEVCIGRHVAEEVEACPTEELYIGKPTARIPEDRNVPLRCRDYCEVCDNCPQWNKWKERNNERSVPAEGPKVIQQTMPEI